MIRFLTAGESHGKSLLTIVEGFPSNLPISIKYLNFHLKRRMQGYGRGGRMEIETDSAEFLSGIRNSKTIGSPISIQIKNNDWNKWKDVLDSNEVVIKDTVTIPRPGHADLNGVLKYNFDDIRNSIERSSARETAIRTAAGTIARRFLEEFNIKIGSFVESIGGVVSEDDYYKMLLLNNYDFGNDAESISIIADSTELRTLKKEYSYKLKTRIDDAKNNGDTLGGTFVVVVSGVSPGLGSFMHFDKKLDAKLAFNLMAINAIKGIQIGSGFESADSTGRNNNDEIIFNGEFKRTTNFSGGIEGGISNGMPILIKCAMKPISTTLNPLKTIDLKSFNEAEARYERSDFTAVPAASVIAEAMTAWTIAECFVEKFGGDSMEEIKDNYNTFKLNYIQRIKNNFKNKDDKN